MNVNYLFGAIGHWKEFEGVHLRGKAFDDNRLHDEEQLARKINNLENTDQACRYQETLNGHFAWVRTKNNEVWLAVNHHRSIPLFYAVDGDNIFISDQVDRIREQVDCVRGRNNSAYVNDNRIHRPDREQNDRISGPDRKQIDGDREPDREQIERFGDQPSRPDLLNAVEMLVLGYVSGPRTLFCSIHQVQAGTIVAISQPDAGSDIRIREHRFFRFVHQYRSGSRRQFTLELDDAIVQTMQRAVEYAGGRPIVLPLSGGYDSRILAITLSRLKYPDVICYTYGTGNNPEAGIARRIAEAHGFKWFKVNYSHRLWRKWFQDPCRQSYYRYAAASAGIPNIQELVALAEMKQHKQLPPDSVIMSGQLGDMLAGGRGAYDSYTYHDHPEPDEDTVVNHVLRYHYYLWNWTDYRQHLRPFFTNRILSGLMPVNDYPDSPGACECWNYQERQAKFIIHAARLYEFFGFDWWMPFCDIEYLKFWLGVPLKFRHDKSLYADYIMSHPPTDIARHYPEKRILAIRERIRHTPLFRPAQALYNYRIKQKKLREEYDRHPFGWYGIVPRSDFRSRYTGRENINSFQSLEILRICFENGFLDANNILKQAGDELTNTDIPNP